MPIGHPEPGIAESAPVNRESSCLAPGAATSLSLLIIALLAGCATHVAPVVPDEFVTLNEHPLRLYFANANAPAGRPLLVYATGDGGMRRGDLDTYRHLAATGDPLVGFDARDYVKHLGHNSPTTTPERVADDYSRIVERARQILAVDAHRPVILVGVSRGAGLAVVAAGRLCHAIEGVVAVALTQEEEYVQWHRHVPLAHQEAHQAVMVDVYEYLAQLDDLPLAVIQSTHDRYLPAAKAREQFGPDTAFRWLQPIEAMNHNFGGARDRMYDAIQAALNWIAVRSTITGKDEGS